MVTREKRAKLLYSLISTLLCLTKIQTLTKIRKLSCNLPHQQISEISRISPQKIQSLSKSSLWNWRSSRLGLLSRKKKGLNRHLQEYTWIKGCIWSYWAESSWSASWLFGVRGFKNEWRWCHFCRWYWWEILACSKSSNLSKIYWARLWVWRRSS